MVRCKQPETPPISAAPREAEWVRWVPAIPGEDSGLAQLSERAVAWINELLGIATKERKLRRIEHKCLDDLEAKGSIRQ